MIRHALYKGCRSDLAYESSWNLKQKSTTRVQVDAYLYHKGSLYGGVYLKKFPNFFKKSFSMRGVYLTFGGVTNIPPWSDFENLARFSKSDPYVHLGGTSCISRSKLHFHHTPHTPHHPCPPAHSCWYSWIHQSTNAAASTTISPKKKKKVEGGRKEQQERAWRMTTTRRPVISVRKNLFVKKSNAAPTAATITVFKRKRRRRWRTARINSWRVMTTSQQQQQQSWDQVAWFCLSAHQLPRRRKRQRDR